MRTTKVESPSGIFKGIFICEDGTAPRYKRQKAYIVLNTVLGRLTVILKFPFSDMKVTREDFDRMWETTTEIDDYYDLDDAEELYKQTEALYACKRLSPPPPGVVLLKEAADMLNGFFIKGGDTVPEGVDLVGKQVSWVQPARDYPQFERRCDGRVVETTWHARESWHTTTVLAVTADRQMILGTPEGDLAAGGTEAAYFCRDDASPGVKAAIEAAGIKPDQKVMLIWAENLR